MLYRPPDNGMHPTANNVDFIRRPPSLFPLRAWWLMAGVGRLRNLTGRQEDHVNKTTILFIGLICVVLFSFSTKAGRFGDGIHLSSDPPRMVVAREWKGRVAPARADEYYRYLLGGVTKLRSIPGSLGVKVMRRSEAGAVEYTVISYWESREAIKAYAGQDIEKPHHLPKDRELLLELPTRVLHYDVTYTDLAQIRVGQ